MEIYPRKNQRGQDQQSKSRESMRSLYFFAYGSGQNKRAPHNYLVVWDLDLKLNSRKQLYFCITWPLSLPTCYPSQLPPPIHPSFNLHNHPTIIHTYYEIYGNSYFMRGIKLWKQLSSEIEHVKTGLEFDRLLTEDVILHLKS